MFERAKINVSQHGAARFLNHKRGRLGAQFALSSRWKSQEMSWSLMYLSNSLHNVRIIHLTADPVKMQLRLVE